MTGNGNLETRIRDLEAIQEIINVEADYAHGVDSRNWDVFANAYSADAVLETPAMGRHEGRQAIVKYFRDLETRYQSFSIRWFHNPHIVVDGDTARGRFYFKVALTLMSTGEAAWCGGSYDDEFTKTKDGWKIKKKKVSHLFFTQYSQGWVKERMRKS